MAGLQQILRQLSVTARGERKANRVEQIRNEIRLNTDVEPVCKITIGNAYPLDEQMTMEVKGRDMVAGVPKTVLVSSEETREALAEPINAIVEAVLLALERTPPELAADIVDKGIVLTGGGALLKNMDVLLREETGLPVMVADDPISAVVLGSGKTLDHIELLKEVAIG